MKSNLLGFIPEPITVNFENILPSHRVVPNVRSSRKFQQIVSSIQAVGLIEPLNISKVDKATKKHLLLDGHLRMLALQDLGYEDSPCLIANDDESYTYNNRVNRLSTIQEHLMIRRAVEKGVTPQKLAKALEIDLVLMGKKIKLLDGICAEAVGLLKDKHFSASISPVLRKMKPTRQVECVELMVATNNITVSYAKALLLATREEFMVDDRKSKKVKGITQEQMAKMEREMSNLEGKYKSVEHHYGEDVLNLVLAKGYIAKLVGNSEIHRFLDLQHPEILEEFSNIIQATSLDQ